MKWNLTIQFSTPYKLLVDRKYLPINNTCKCFFKKFTILLTWIMKFMYFMVFKADMIQLLISFFPWKQSETVICVPSYTQKRFVKSSLISVQFTQLHLQVDFYNRHVYPCAFHTTKLKEISLNLCFVKSTLEMT